MHNSESDVWARAPLSGMLVNYIAARVTRVWVDFSGVPYIYVDAENMERLYSYSGR